LPKIRIGRYADFAGEDVERRLGFAASQPLDRSIVQKVLSHKLCFEDKTLFEP